MQGLEIGFVMCLRPMVVKEVLVGVRSVLVPMGNWVFWGRKAWWTWMVRIEDGNSWRERERMERQTACHLLL